MSKMCDRVNNNIYIFFINNITILLYIERYCENGNFYKKTIMK